MVRCGIRPAQIRAVEQAVASRNHDARITSNATADSRPLRLAEVIADGGADSTADNHIMELSSPAQGATTSVSSRDSARHATTSAAAVPQLRRAHSDPTDSDISVNSHNRGPPASLAATAPIRGNVSRANTQDSAGSDAEAFGTGPSSNRKFSPDYFYAIMTDGPPLPTSIAPIYTERDVGTAFTNISEGLTKPADHWEDRMAALQRLQALSCTDALDYDSFPLHLKGIHEQVPAY